mmetsp:Transcript_21470/g.67727  ORF Transcript_21470/g.67727 Transcript_21470/m.67727 type:complete len:426 (+) Transcript_21470:155-1432(+)
MALVPIARMRERVPDLQRGQFGEDVLAKCTSLQTHKVALDSPRHVICGDEALCDALGPPGKQAKHLRRHCLPVEAASPPDCIDVVGILPRKKLEVGQVAGAVSVVWRAAVPDASIAHHARPQRERCEGRPQHAARLRILPHGPLRMARTAVGRPDARRPVVLVDGVHRKVDDDHRRPKLCVAGDGHPGDVGVQVLILPDPTQDHLAAAAPQDVAVLAEDAVQSVQHRVAQQEGPLGVVQLLPARRCRSHGVAAAPAVPLAPHVDGEHLVGDRHAPTQHARARVRAQGAVQDREPVLRHHRRGARGGHGVGIDGEGGGVAVVGRQPDKVKRAAGQLHCVGGRAAALRRHCWSLRSVEQACLSRGARLVRAAASPLIGKLARTVACFVCTRLPPTPWHGLEALQPPSEAGAGASRSPGKRRPSSRMP